MPFRSKLPSRAGIKTATTLPALLACLPLTAPAAETYTVDPNHTGVTFAFQHLGLSTFFGKFSGASGAITLDREKGEGSARIEIDATGIATGVPKFDEHLRSADFFDVEKHPRITFVSKRFPYRDGKVTEVPGELTVRGVTRPVTLEVTYFNCKEHPMKKVPACGANADARIKRSEFGLDEYVPAVSDEIALEISVEALRNDGT
ncbi:MAG: polyisoprenoid-binding protein [Proteobacteria bacterium]|nr:MAG: polyisoprenoid-binding protein [Pseudomonadota bacterium]